MSRRTIRTKIDNLIGGVSQQPPGVRPTNQCEVQDNAYASVVDGLSKRQPTEHVGKLSTSAGGGTLQNVDIDKNTGIFWLDNYNDDRYVVLVESAVGGAGYPKDAIMGPTYSWPSPVRVFDLADGKEVAVTKTGGTALTASDTESLYFDSTNPKRDFRLTTINKDAYISNRARVTGMKSDLTDSYNFKALSGDTSDDYRSLSSRRKFLFLSETNPKTRYAVRFAVKFGDVHPDAAKRNAWSPNILDDEQAEAAVAWVKTYSGVVGTSSPNLKFGDEEDMPRYVVVTGTVTHARGHMIWTLNVAEVLWDLYFHPGETGTTESYPGGIKQVFEDRVTAQFGSYPTWMEPDQILQVTKRSDQRWEDMQHRSAVTAPASFANTMPTLMPPGAGPVMMFEISPTNKDSYAFREDINLEVVDDGGGALFAFGDEVQRLDQLPLVCKNGHRVRIKGIDDGEEGDDWYVEFEVTKPETATDFGVGEGEWKESAKSLITYKIDEDTMPHKLTRVADATEPSGYRFELAAESWDDRLVGDDDTNPEPWFIGRTISNVFFWRNRFGILSDSHVVMSEADEYTNFWRTSVRQLLESDPIDLDASHENVERLNWAEPLDERLVVFTEDAQFIVTGEPILSPKTASIRLSTKFENLPLVQPVTAERGVFFAFPSAGGSFTQVQQLLSSQESNTLDVFPSSAQIPRYMQGELAQLDATSLDSALVARSDNDFDSHVLYVHTWFDRQRERLLSAWQRFLLGPGTKTAAELQHTRILSTHFVDSELYLLMHRHNESTGNTQFSLEKMRIAGARQPDTNTTSNGALTATSDYRCLLDRRVTVGLGVTGTPTVTQSGENLKIPLPYEVQSDGSGDAEMMVVSRVNPTPSAVPEGRQYDFTLASNKTDILIPDQDGSLYDAYVAGTLQFYVGQSYTMTYQFSRPVIRERSESGAVGQMALGRHVLRRGRLVFEDSGALDMVVTPETHADGTAIVSRDEQRYSLPQMEMSLARTHLTDVNIRSGHLDFLIMSTPDKVKLIIENDTPYPCHPQQLELTSTYTTKARAIGRR